jgi:hypothetical protein
MKSKKSLIVLGLMAGMLVFFTLTSQVLAGGAGIEPPPDGSVITGPEIWGVVVMYCGPGPDDDLAIIRIKYLDNCNVYTQALKDLNWDDAIGCPANSGAVEGQSLPVGTQFLSPTGTPFPGTPFFTKVKNYRAETTGGLVSFDAQFKFWTSP